MTRAAIIRKNAAVLAPAPHLLDYAGERRRFSWDAVRAELGTMPGGGINIAWAAVDRHLGTPVRDHVAFRFLGRDAHRNALHNDSRRDITYAITTSPGTSRGAMPTATSGSSAAPMT